MESPTPQPAPGSATFMEGCKDSLPIVISYIPVAFAFGLNATRLGFSPLESVFFSCIIYAGASQFVITAMLAAGSSLWVAALTVMAMDVRHVLYGPSLRSRIIQRLQKSKTALWAFGLTDEVFVAIPRPKKGAREKAWQDMLRLLKRLELGLLTVALDSPLKTVDVVLTPADSMIRKNKRKKEQLQAELEGRQLDANIGGMTRRKIITAYRERVIRLACILEREGEISLAELRARGLEELAVLLSRNYEKWFVRVEKGVYALSEKGKNELKRADYAKVAAYYRQEQLGRNEETI